MTGHTHRGIAGLAIAALAFGAPVALGGCSSEPVSGTVTAKQTDRDCRTKKSGKKRKRTCDTDYELAVRDAQGQTHEVDVSKATYDKTQVGSQYSD